MRKKILLYALSLGLILAVCFGLRGLIFPNAGRNSHTVHPLAVAKGTGMVNMVVETRNPQGDLEYVLRAKKAVPEGNGRYKLTSPQMQFYTSNGQTILVASQTGDVMVDQTGSTFSGHVYPRKGSLSGNPTITLGPLNTFLPGNTTRQPGQIQMRLSRAIHFNYQEGLITSAGAVRVRGDTLWFNGKKLTAEINVSKKSLEYLRISQGQRLILRHAMRQSRTVSPNGSVPATTRVPNTRPAPPASGTAPAHVSPAAGTTAQNYRLIFGKHVHVSLGVRSLAAHRLVLLFDQGGSGAGANTATQPAAPASPAKAGAATTPESGVTTRPDTGNIGPDDLVVDWTGPLTIRPDTNAADRKLVSSHNTVLMAYGRAGKPVILHDGPQRTGTAAELTYQTGAQRLTMKSHGLAPLRFTDAAVGTLTCRTLTLNNATHHLVLIGPGQFAMQPNPKKMPKGLPANAPPTGVAGQWKGHWLGQLAIVLAPGNTANQAKVSLRQVTIQGNAVLHSRTLRISGQTLLARLQHAPSSGGAEQLSYFSGLGNVLVQNWASPTALPDQLACQHLQLFTHKNAASGRVTPSRLVADGQVKLLFHEAKKPGTAHAGVYRIAAHHLVAHLQSAQPVAKGVKPATAGPFGSGRYQVTTFHAWKQVKLVISGSGKPIVATAYSLRGDRVTGAASLAAIQPGVQPALWPEIQQGNDDLSAEQINMNRTHQSLSIHGPGFLDMESKGTSGKSAPSHVRLTWTDRMNFNGNAHQADFSGAVLATLLGQPRRSSTLACPHLHIVFYKSGRAASMHMAQLNAIGSIANPVIAREASYSPKGLLRTRLYLNSSLLTYNAVKQTLSIPAAGKMLLEDYRTAKSKPGATPSQRGQSAFAWKQRLTYRSKTGILSMHHGVQLVFRPMSPLKNPVSANAGPSTAPAAGANAGLVILHCHELMATLDRQATAAPRGSELGLGGPTRLSLVRAQNAAMELMGIRLVADVLSLNAKTQLAKAYGLNGHEAMVTGQHGKMNTVAQKIIWDLAKGRQGLTFYHPRGLVQTP